MIKKRKGWYTWQKPTAPSAPRKPEPTLTYTESQVVYEHTGFGLKLSDVPVPEGNSLADLTVSARGDEDGDITFEFSLEREVTKPNLTYEREMKHYKAEYENWQARKAEHKLEVKEWEVWKAQEERAQLDAQLANAEGLLRKHGRLPGGPSVG